VRHELLPYLAQHVSEGIVDVLARQAVIAREDADYLEHAATETSGSLVLERDGRTVVPLSALLDLPPALRRRVVRRALQRHAGERFVGFDQVEAVLALAREENHEAKVIDQPGQRVQRIMGRLVFETVAADAGREGRRRGRARPSLGPEVAPAETRGR
jgi:tRNA(Ile)-lysidine synthase